MDILKMSKLNEKYIDLETKLLNFHIKSTEEFKRGSNHIFLCKMSNLKENFYAIYKPKIGEKPLRDFKYGSLYKREIASYEISKFLNWPKLPPIVIRDGIYGEGSFQFYIPHDPSNNYFDLYEKYKKELELVALFDLIILNTDRKAGSILIDEDMQIWSIDQALSFNSYTRIRTVMFEYNNRLIQDKQIKEIKILIDNLESESILLNSLNDLLDKEEILSLLKRCKQIVNYKFFPDLDPYYNVPYPLI